MEFKNKVAVITGGANGIGLAIAKEFAKQGALISLMDIDQQSGEKALLWFENLGLECLFVLGDVGKKEDLDLLVEKTLQKYSRIDFLINNACISKGGLLSGCSYEDFDEVLSIGLKAPYYLTLKASPSLTKAKGCILNISSTRYLMSQPDTESYTAAKGGIVSLTHACAVSLAPDVRVNCISPGWIDTSENNADDFSKADKSQHPTGRVGTPEDIAHLALFLCSEKASFITGQNFIVDGGMTKNMIYHGDNGWEYRP